MGFAENGAQQISMFDALSGLTKREQRILEKSWATGFADIIFPFIDEAPYSVLYNEASGRPNTPVNIVIGALILKEMQGLTDDQLLESVLFDVRFQCALKTTSWKEQPFSDRTVSRLRAKLYQYEVETGIDLLKQTMEDLTSKIMEFFHLNPTVKRMDSIMVSTNAKKLTRLELVYTCVADMVRVVNQTGETGWLNKELLRYLEEERKNNVIYRSKSENQEGYLEEALKDACTLLDSVKNSYEEFEEYRALHRLVKEQTITADGKIEIKPSKEISPTSMQNPSDPDATYRNKAGKGHTGYVGNFVETVGGVVSLIESYDYQPNSYSDSTFCKDVIENNHAGENRVLMITDGAYGSVENTNLADEKNMELVTTCLSGKNTNPVADEFVVDPETNQVIQCPCGNEPLKSSYSEKRESYRINFAKGTCETCPNREKCNAKEQKKSDTVMISITSIQRALYGKKLSTEKYKEYGHIRNGVEGIPSILRRKYHIDAIPVRGLLRSKIWYAFKMMAINVTRTIAAV